MRDEALKVADELLKTYTLLTVKASMVITELVRENDKLLKQIEESEGKDVQKA